MKGKLSEAIDRFANQRILVVGDVMLDRYVYGDVKRISPEAPIQILSKDHESLMLGGAGNVVRNLQSLGATVSFVSVVGPDEAGSEIRRIIAHDKDFGPTGSLAYIFVEKNRVTPEKVRFVSEGQQLLRVDHERAADIHDTLPDIRRTVECIVEEHDIVVLSDYSKGVLSTSVIRDVIRLAKAAGKMIVVDPKKHIACYEGATLITPNLKELNASFEDAPQRARSDSRACNISNVLVTCSELGMILVNGYNMRHFRSSAQMVVDVSGAGDTVVAVMALGLSSRLTATESAQLASLAAGVVVGKRGTATIDRGELKTALYFNEVHDKVVSVDVAIDKIKHDWAGKTVGLANGVFDMLHTGHLNLLNNAKKHCDKLIVAINSDASVKRLKGDGRPIHNQYDRAKLLAGLSVVDMILIFDEDSPLELITKVSPKILFKGSDYRSEDVIGGDVVVSHGGGVIILPHTDGVSTTSIFEACKLYDAARKRR